MWVYNNDLQKWYRSDDTLLKGDFEYLKQELSSTRYYSKALSGSTYMIINDLNNMYDILNSWRPRNWYISTLGSKFSKSLNPKYYPESIDITSQDDFYNKNIKEYGLSLKNLFTPDRVINEFMENYIQVDLATDTSLNLSLPIDKIDGVKLLEGHKVLVKNQTSKSTLNINDKPEDFFEGDYRVSNTVGTSVEYEYYNELNGIYTYKNGSLVKSTDYDNYENCIRLSLNVAMGTVNAGKQYHLNRLLNGFYPKNGEPMYFNEGHNWMVRNRVDYNNLFEINYYDILKNPYEKITKNGIVYSIPERIIQIGEFGVFTNTQFGKTNLIDCKWKVNLRSISQTENYYWVCGDNTTLLKVDKTNFEIEFIKIDTFSSFKSIQFYDNLRGVLVGDFNNIYITDDGGLKWKELRFQNFNSYSYNKVLFKSKSKFYVCGNGGVFIEFQEDIDGWVSHKRRISKKTDDGDDLLLVDMINDMVLLENNTNLLSKTISNGILLATNDSKLLIYDEDKKTGYDFIYLNFNNNYGDIKFLSNTGDYFSSDKGLFNFNLSNWSILNLNTSISNIEPTLSFDKSVNRIFKYSNELYIVGNYSLNKVLEVSPDYLNSVKISDAVTVKKDLTYLSKIEINGNFTSQIIPNNTIISFTYIDETSTLKTWIGKVTSVIYNGGVTIIQPDYTILTPSTTTNSNMIGNQKLYVIKNFVYNQKEIDSTFYGRLKSKLVFLNYDIASKLNFFTDEGEYRLPNSVSIQADYFTNTSILNLTNISVSGQNQLTWYDYWLDKEKTFKYGTTVFNDTNSIKPSLTFKGTQKLNTIKVFKISASASNNSMYNDLSFNKTNLTNWNANSNNYNLYLKGNLMALYNFDGNFTVEEGDILRMKSNLIDANFLVNKIDSNWIYMYSNFNDNIIKNLTKGINVEFTNLNKFKDYNTFISNFNNHSIGNGYKSSLVNNSIKIEPTFNNLTSYYNLSTKISATSSVGSNPNFIKFSSPDMLNYGIPDGKVSLPQTLNCDTNIFVND